MRDGVEQVSLRVDQCSKMSTMELKSIDSERVHHDVWKLSTGPWR